MPNNTVIVTTMDEKMDIIIGHLEAMNKRDKLRTTGAFIRGMLGLIPLIFFVWSIWFAINHGDELLKQITTQAATAAAEATKNGGQGMLDDLLKKYDFPNGKSSSAAQR
jgi:hypothetical protein